MIKSLAFVAIYAIITFGMIDRAMPNGQMSQQTVNNFFGSFQK